MSLNVVVRTANADIVAEYAQSDLSDLNNLTRGETSTIELHFASDTETTLTVTDSYTVDSGTIEYYQSVTVESGGTLTINGTLETAELTDNGTVNVNGTLIVSALERGSSGIIECLKYDDYSGGFTTQKLINSTVKYRPQIPTTADINSLLVGIEPPDKLSNNAVPGIWGLVSNVTDTRPRALSDKTVRFELTVLAEFDEYNDHNTAKTDLIV